MIKSMTGFGRAESNLSGFNISIQIKSVNHRYGDFSIRLPRIYGFLEELIRSKISDVISVEQNLATLNKIKSTAIPS